LTAPLFRKTSPAPPKDALSLLGLTTPRLRLPLVEVSDAIKADIAAALAQVCEDYGGYVAGTMQAPEVSARSNLNGPWGWRPAD
jgi:hypothetical protein